MAPVNESAEAERADPSSELGDYVAMRKRRPNVSVFLLKPTDACYNDVIAGLKSRNSATPTVEFDDDGNNGCLK